MSGEFVSARKAAELTGVVERTVRRWIERGRLPAERDASGIYQVPVAALQPFMRAELESSEHQAESAADVKDIGPQLEDLPRVTVVMPESWVERAVRAETKIKVARGLLALGVNAEAVMVVLEAE